MSIFKRIFSQLTDKAYDAPFEVLAQDDKAVDRARNIAAAFNRSLDPYPYLEFREKHLKDLDKQLRGWDMLYDGMKQLWESSVQHTKTVTELASQGDDTLMQNAPRLQRAEAELHNQRQQMQKAVHDTKGDMDRLKDMFTMLSNAEKQMPRLKEDYKKHVTDGLRMLDHQGAQLNQMLSQLPTANNDVENALATIRNAEIDRANQQRQAIAEAEAQGRKIKFNEYLKTGLATGTAVTAPKTARFTRRPKPQSA